MGNEWSNKLKDTTPISIVRIRDVPDDSGKSFIFTEEHVSECLLAPEVRKTPVVVISVAGVARTGKSFFLAFLLRYAVIRFLEGSKDPGWLGDGETKMGGFEFEHSIVMKTNGIVMWPMLFECMKETGEKVCILLIDTQGMYDSGQGSSTIWATVFAMSALMSSLQIYNIEEEITEEDLQSLELDVGFMRLMTNHFASERPGQHLLFLIRDFKLKDHYGYGHDGGKRYLQEKVFTNDVDNMHKEVRDRIKEGFSKIECCALPYPGRSVVESKHFDGKVKDIDTKFQRFAKETVETILAPNNLVMKTVNGRPMTCEDLLHHMATLVDSFNKLAIPTVVSPLRALADSDHVAAVEEALKLYVANMNAAGCTKGIKAEYNLDTIHEESFNRALKHFKTKPKIGQGDIITPFHATKLHSAIIKKYDEYAIQNLARLAGIRRELPVWSIILLGVLTFWDDLKPTPELKWPK